MIEKETLEAMAHCSNHTLLFSILLREAPEELLSLIEKTRVKPFLQRVDPEYYSALTAIGNKENLATILEDEASIVTDFFQDEEDETNLQYDVTCLYAEASIEPSTCIKSNDAFKNELIARVKILFSQDPLPLNGIVKKLTEII